MEYNEYDYYDDDDDKVDFTEGEISGFAIQNPEDSNMPAEASDKVFLSLPTPNNEQPILPMPTMMIPTNQGPAAKSGHGGGGWAQSGSGPWSQSSGHGPAPGWDDGGGHFEVHDSSDKKELGFKEIVDIALTTLAFLAFGMFFLQVILCITMNKDDGSNLMMMPMEGNATVFEDVIEIRRKREIFNPLENVRF